MLEDTGFGTVFKSYGEGNAGKGVWGAGGGVGEEVGDGVMKSLTAIST